MPDQVPPASHSFRSPTISRCRARCPSQFQPPGVMDKYLYKYINMYQCLHIHMKPYVYKIGLHVYIVYTYTYTTRRVNISFYSYFKISYCLFRSKGCRPAHPAWPSGVPGEGVLWCGLQRSLGARTLSIIRVRPSRYVGCFYYPCSGAQNGSAETLEGEAREQNENPARLRARHDTGGRGAPSG